MKKTFRFLSMAALALVGAMMTGCSNDEDFSTPQQPENKSNIVTLTTTVGFDTSASTRALTSTGVKTFAVDDQIAVIYTKNGGTVTKAVSEKLISTDIASGSKSATFTVTLDDPDKTKNVTYIYPAAMAGTTDVDYTKLSSQDGTLTTLSSNLDYCTKSGAWNGDNLPTLTLDNQLAILAITLKNEAGTSDITGSTTKLTVSDGTNTYNVNRSVAEGPIYVAIRPTTSATIDITATSDSKGYYKILTTPKSYTASNGYSVSWKMTQGANLSKLTAAYTAQNGETLTGTLGANVQISIAAGATVTLDGVTINGTHNYSYTWAGLTCLGDATIILKDESVNSVVGFCYSYPGIYIPHGKTLTIQGETLGTGVLNATGAGYSAGIGAARENVDIYRSCGNIVIAGGVINATAGGERAAGIGCGGTTNPSTANPSTCGTITITGGTITATGGMWAPGIGSGFYAKCGDITIANTVTRVTATKGDRSGYLATTFDCIGKGRQGSCGTVKFGTQTMYDGSSWTTTPTSGNTYDGLSLTISPTTYDADTWTLTPVAP